MIPYLLKLSFLSFITVIYNSKYIEFITMQIFALSFYISNF